MTGTESAQTFLFVPGHRPDRFDKAAAAGADAVILDLEDAVAPADKETARDHVARWLATGGQAAVRVNAPGTTWFDADLALAARHGVPVMVPKAEDAHVLAEIAERAPGAALIALIETAIGIEHACSLCAVPAVRRAAFGSVDLAAQLGIRHDDTLALTFARSRLVIASAAAGIAPPIDGVTTDIANHDLLAADVGHARRLGFTAKLCIHPRQVPLVRAGFAPTEDELRWAERVLDAGDAVSAVDGQMIDKPVLAHARRLLGRT